MLDLDALNIGILSRITSTSGLSTISSKTSYGFLDEKVAKPKCRVQTVSDALRGAYGHLLLNQVTYQFSIFADALSTATGLQKALAAAFNGIKLSLSSGTNVGCRVTENHRLLVEDQTPTAVVYHAIVVIEFRVH